MTSTLTRRHTSTSPEAVTPPESVRLTTLTTTALREKRNLGDLTQLAAHLARHGLRQPVTLNPARQLVIGARRLLAAQQAGLDVIPARTISTVQQALDIITAERAADQADPDTAALVLPPTILALLELDAAVRTLEWWPRDGQQSRMDHRTALASAADNLDGTRFWNNAHYSHGRRLYLAAQGYHAAGGVRNNRITSAEQRAAASLLAQLSHQDVARLTTLYRQWQAGNPPGAGPDSTLISSENLPGVLASLRGMAGAVTRAGLPGPDLTIDDLTSLDQAAANLIRRLSHLRKGIPS